MTEALQRTDLEEVQDEHTAPDIDVEMRRGGISGDQKLHATLDEMASDFDVDGFKCAHEDCGLVHTHSTTKHRASDDFDVSDEEAGNMEANPNCHCGLGEMARRDVEGAPSPSRANSMAPIPDKMARRLDATL